MELRYMSKISETTRETWVLSSFPEWGTWLNEEIESKRVAPGSATMWWLGCTGIVIKSPADIRIAIDLWTGNGKRTHGNGMMAPGHQMANMCGSRKMQPNLRNAPVVFDPFAFKRLDAVLATHYHHDHMSKEVAAHVINSKMTTRNASGEDIPVPFVGPKKSVECWQEWGVPPERCITVKPGDELKFGDLEIVVLDSFDRTCITTTDSTGPDREELWGKCPMDMDEKAVNYLIRTPGGNIYHSGDSHYSICFAEHGKRIKRLYGGVDVCFGSYGCNPVGLQDKMEATDILRMAEALQSKVVIPIHWDVWTNFYADLREIEVLWEMRRNRLNYQFHPFFWKVGGSYTLPNDYSKIEYMYERGFDDCFEHSPNVPFRSVL
jgi:L-ascorbate 6-phosphate lactonase